MTPKSSNLENSQNLLFFFKSRKFLIMEVPNILNSEIPKISQLSNFEDHQISEILQFQKN